MAKAEEREPEPELVELVRFNGKPGVRLITAEEWEGAGVKDHPPTYWDVNNDWTVKRSDLGLNDEQYARIVIADKGFSIERVPAS